MYVRDAIDAAKVILKIKDEKKIEDLWKTVEDASKRDIRMKKQKKTTTKTVHRLEGILKPDSKVDV